VQHQVATALLAAGVNIATIAKATGLSEADSKLNLKNAQR